MPARRLNRIQDLEILKKFNDGKTLTQLKREFGYTHTKSIKNAIERAKNNIDDKYLGWSKERVFDYAKNLIAKYGKLPSAKWLVYNNESGFDTAVKRHYGGYVKLRKDLGEKLLRVPWDKERVINCAKKLIAEQGDLPTQDWLNENGYKDFVGGAFRNYEGGITQLRFDQDIQFGKGVILWNKKLILEYAKRLLRDLGDLPHYSALQYSGHNGFAQAVNKHYPGRLEQLRDDLNLSPLISNIGGDGIDKVIDRSFVDEEETDLYIYSLKRFTNYKKIGIAFDHELRAQKDEEYGELISVWRRSSRAEAYFVENAILYETRIYHSVPNQLVQKGWSGWTELRQVDNNVLIERIQFLIDQIDELGLWNFALEFINLTDDQKKKINHKII